MADAPIQFRRTVNPIPASIPSGDGTTAHLLSGEPAVALAASSVTKLWIGDGTVNRLVLSSDLATDPSPLFTQGYLKLSGGSLTGPIKTTVTTPTGPDAGEWLVNKDYVDEAVASGQQRVGAYNAATNTPALNPPTPTPTNGQFWDVSVGGLATTGIPGINAGEAINAGAKLVWNTSIPGFDLIPGGGITQGEGDLRYVRLAGSVMEAGAAITMTAPYAPTGLEVATAAYVGTELANYLPLSGGSLAGPGSITTTGNISTTGTGGLSIAGTSTLTGNVTIGAGSSITMPTGYAPTGLQVATASSVTTQLGDYLALTGGALTGNLSMTGTLSVTGTSTLTGNVTANAGLMVGNPTGGMQAAGSINAQSIYLNGVAVTLGVDGGTFT